MKAFTTRREIAHPDGPIRHKPSGRKVAGPRSSAAAVCGAAAPRPLDEEWDPKHPRSCSRCAKADDR